MLPLRMLLHISKMENAFALLGAPAAQRQETGQKSVRLTIRGLAEEVHALGQIETAAHDKTCFYRRIFFQVRMRQDNAGQSIPVSQREGGMIRYARGLG